MVDFPPPEPLKIYLDLPLSYTKGDVVKNCLILIGEVYVPKFDSGNNGLVGGHSRPHAADIFISVERINRLAISVNGTQTFIHFPLHSQAFGSPLYRTLSMV